MQIPDWNKIAGSTGKPSQEQIARVIRIVNEVQSLSVVDRAVVAFLIAHMSMADLKEAKESRT
jgi:hypothetical protein